jgi:hypothetical protein
MTSAQHRLWISRGKPDRGLALPLQLLANTLSGAGYTVYVYPNDDHLDAQPPEDHTYYSETGWPGNSPYGWRHAIDIMPPPAGRGLPSLQQIGQRLYDARQAGQITWLKYMNWPSDGNLSRAVQDSWKPSHRRGTSSDVGHIHISSTTGCETLDSSFNPLSSIVVVGIPPVPIPIIEEELPVFAAHDSQGQVYLCDGIRSRPVPLQWRGDVETLIREGLIKLSNDFGNSRGGWYEGAFGLLPAASVAPAVIDSGVLQAAVEAALRAVGVSVSPAQVASALEDPAVKAVLVSAAQAGANLAEDS